MDDYGATQVIHFFCDRILFLIDLKQINTGILWYVVGYIVADGSLSIDKRHINITSKDQNHLIKIREALGLKIRVGEKFRSSDKTKTYFQLQIGDVRFYRYLESVGITPNKSLTIQKVAINKQFFNDFLRGIIDGDGNISTWIHRTNGHRQWSLRIFSGSLNFLLWLNQEIESAFYFSGKIHTRVEFGKKNPIYILKFGKRKAKSIFEKSYNFNSYHSKESFYRCNYVCKISLKMVN
jgi:hypothetical protein